MMRKTVLSLLGVTALAACDPSAFQTAPEKPKGPPIEITKAVRAGDTAKITMRYKDGGVIPREDESRAVLKAMEISCQEGESGIPDTRTRADGQLTVNIFCVGVLTSDEVIDGSGLKS